MEYSEELSAANGEAPTSTVKEGGAALPLSRKVQNQIAKAGLPTAGQVPFIPAIVTNPRGQQEIEKRPVLHGPKKNKVGHVDTQGRIWIKDRAHAGYSDHWDVQDDGGMTYFKVDLDGNMLAPADS